MDELLIDLVSQHEVIYNVKSEEYSDAGLRSAAWEEISQQYGKPTEECKEDWNKLRNCYSKALKRRLKNSKTGKRIPPWRFETEMAFLLPYVQTKTIELNGHTAEDPLENPSSQKNTTVLKYSPTPSCSSPPNKRRTSVNDYMDPLQYANVMDASDRFSQVDDSDHFFLTMSRMVKKLPRRDQIRIQMDLHKAIYETEMKHLEAESLTQCKRERSK